MNYNFGEEIGSHLSLVGTYGKTIIIGRITKILVTEHKIDSFVNMARVILKYFVGHLKLALRNFDI